MITPNDIVLHLATYLPRVTNIFSVMPTVISSDVISENTIYINAANHGLTVDTPLAVTSGLLNNPIIDVQLKNIGAELVFTTQDDHDYTVPPCITQYVELGGFTLSSVYDGKHELIGVPNRRNFSISLPANQFVAPVLNGNEVVKEDRNLGIKGYHTVTSVPDENSFLIQIDNVPPLPINYITELGLTQNVRIAAVSDIDRAREIYSRQNIDQGIWAFVIMGDVDVSKDRYTLNDATAGFTSQDNLLIRYLQNFSVVIFIPTVNDVSGSEAQNLAYGEIFDSLCKVLFGFGFNDPISKINYVTVSNGHGPNPFNTSWYEHVYEWQLPAASNYEDGFGFTEDVAFRDIHSVWDINRDAAAQMVLNINLDEEPLE